MHHIIFAALLLGTAAAAGEGIAVGPEIPLPADGPGKGLQGEPAVAFGKDIYLVAWREGWHGEGGASRILAARVDRSGKPLDSARGPERAKRVEGVLDPQGIAVASDAAGVQDRPRVAFGGGVFLVVWQELTGGKQYDVRAARVSPEGKVLDAKSIAVAAGPESEAMPDVASDGQGFVVVWQGAVVAGGDTEFRVTSAAVSAAGAVGAPTKLFCGGVPGIAWDGKSYFVVGSPLITGIRLDASGKLALAKDKPSSAVNYRDPGEFRDEYTRSLAGGGAGGWLVVCDRSQPDYWGWGGAGAMRTYLFGPDGTKDPGIQAEPSGNKSRLPNWLDISSASGWPSGASAAAWDGKRYVAVWQRYHTEKVVVFKNCDLIASRVDGFKPLDAAGVPVAASDCDEKAPALASDGAGGLLCAYEKHGQDGRVGICARTIRTE